MSLSAHHPQLFDTSLLKNLEEASVAIVSTEWNASIVDALREGVWRILKAHNCSIDHDVVVPGSFEIPFACNRLSTLTVNAPEAIIALGAVIRGGTPHFEYVCQAVTYGIAHLNATGNVPVIFGILTLDTEAQAWERLGGSHGHKGEEAALAALKMIYNNRQLKF